MVQFKLDKDWVAGNSASIELLLRRTLVRLQAYSSSYL